MNILIFLFFILFIILSKIRLEWAVIFVLATLPSYLIRFKIFGIPFTVLEGMILISFFVWAIGNYRTIVSNIFLKINNYKKSLNSRPDPKRYPFDAEIALLLIISFVSVGVTGFSNEALGIWKAYFFEPILFYILVVNIFANKKKTEAELPKLSGSLASVFFFPLSISAFLISLFAIYQKFTGVFILNPLWAAEETRRVTSIFDYPNALGLYLGPIVLLLVGWLLSRVKDYYNKCGCQLEKTNKLPLNPFIFLTIILSIISIYYARSEGALIGVLAGLIVFGFFLGKKVRWLTLILIVMGGFFIFSVPTLKIKVIDKIKLKDFSGEIRKQQWRETSQVLMSSPSRLIFGTGLSNYQQEIKPYHQEGIFFNKNNDPDFRRKIVIFDEQYKAEHWFPVEIYMYPHNIFFNFWTELGLAGVLLFSWIIGKFFYIGFNNKKKNFALGLICSMIVIVVHGLVDVPYFKNDLAVLFWLLIAVMGIINLKKDEKTTSTSKIYS